MKTPKPTKPHKSNPEHELQAAITAYLNSLDCIKRQQAAFYNSEKGFTGYSYYIVKIIYLIKKTPENGTLF